MRAVLIGTSRSRGCCSTTTRVRVSQPRQVTAIADHLRPPAPLADRRAAPVTARTSSSRSRRHARSGEEQSVLRGHGGGDHLGHRRCSPARRACAPGSRRWPAPDVHPAVEPARVAGHGRPGSRAGPPAALRRARFARSITRSVSAPQACAETTRSVEARGTVVERRLAQLDPAGEPWPGPHQRLAELRRARRDARDRRPAPTARCRRGARGARRSRPWPQARSTTRPPRKRRRARRATSHDSNSSLRGRQSAEHTARATLSKSDSGRETPPPIVASGESAPTRDARPAHPSSPETPPSSSAFRARGLAPSAVRQPGSPGSDVGAPGPVRPVTCEARFAA